MDVLAATQQELDHVGLLNVNCYKQRRTARIVGRMDVRAAIQQELDHVGLLSPNCTKQRCQPSIVHNFQEAIVVIEQRFYDGQVSVVAGKRDS